MKVIKNTGKSKALATMIEDEQSLPYTEVNLEGDVSATEDSASSSNSPDGPAPGGVERPKLVERRLTEVSRQYDRGNKGFLNETEQALRRMDSQNKGFIDQDKAYLIMDSLVREQKQSEELLNEIRQEHQKSMSLKRGLIFMGCFAVLLAIANIGTSFVAVKLIKDSEVSSSNDLVALNGVRLGTTSKQVEFKIHAGASNSAERRRLVEESLCSNTASGYQCDVTGYMDLESSIALYKEFCSDWNENVPTDRCQGGGVESLLLNCNGVRSTVLGGMYIPQDGPEKDVAAGFWAFPSLIGSYRVRENVYQGLTATGTTASTNSWGTTTFQSNSASCILEYDVTFYCFLDDSECAIISTWDLEACPDVSGPNICSSGDSSV